MLFAMLLLALLHPANAATLLVPSVYPTLIDAVDAAVSGDTISLAAGWDGSAEAAVTVEYKDLYFVGDSASPAQMPPMILEGVNTELSDVDFRTTSLLNVEHYDSDEETPIGLAAGYGVLRLTRVRLADLDGIGLYLQNNVTHAYDVSFEGLTGYTPLFFVADGRDYLLTMQDGSFAGCDSGAMVVKASSGDTATLEVDGTTFQDIGSANYDGIVLSGAVGTLTNVAFSDTDTSVWPTAKISSIDSSLTISGATFTDLSGGNSGADSSIIYAEKGDLTVESTSFRWPTVAANPGQVIAAYNLESFGISGVSIEGVQTSVAPVVVQACGPTTIDDLVIRESTGSYGALVASSSDPVTIRRSRFCANVGYDATGAIIHMSDTDLDLSGSILGSNRTSVAMIYLDTSAATITNVDFADNAASEGSLYAGFSSDSFLVQNTIFYSEELVFGGPGTVSESFNLYYENTETGISTSSSDDIFLDPQFVSYDPADCDSYPELQSGSPAIDAGTGGNDADGSPYDIGAMSGANPLLVPIIDADGDGYPEEEDCDDDNAGAHPDATEIAYDGVDQDCDGADLVDIDGDGYLGDAVGGDDCDDTDASIGPCDTGLPPDTGETAETGTGLGEGVDADGDGFAALTDCDDGEAGVFPGAWDDPGTDVDENCDGGNAEIAVAGGCGCSSPAGDLSIGLALVAGTLWRRRPSPIDQI